MIFKHLHLHDPIVPPYVDKKHGQDQEIGQRIEGRGGLFPFSVVKLFCLLFIFSAGVVMVLY